MIDLGYFFTPPGVHWVGNLMLALIIAIVVARFVFPLELRRQTNFLVDQHEWPRASQIPAGFLNRFAGWMMLLVLFAALFLALAVIIGNIRV